MSPSGKAAGFGPVIRRFDPCHPSHFDITARVWLDFTGSVVEGTSLRSVRSLPSQPF